MTKRYERLMLRRSLMISVGCPVVLCSGALTKDTQTGRVFAQLRIGNLSKKKLKGAKVKLQLLDIVGAPFGEPVEFSYLDLLVARGEEFGGKTPIWLSDNTARGFFVTAITLYYNDNSSKECTDLSWVSLPDQQTLDDKFNSAQISAYQARFTKNHRFLPDVYEDVWRCSCGAINMKDYSCFHCGGTYDLISDLDPDQLTIESAKRLIDRYQYQKAIELLQPLAGNQTADQMLADCAKAVANIREVEEAEQLERVQREEQKRLTEKQEIRDNRKKTVIAISVIIAVILMIVLIFKVLCQSGNIMRLLSLMRTKQTMGIYRLCLIASNRNVVIATRCCL